MKIIISNQQEADLLCVIAKIAPSGIHIDVEGGGEYYMDKEIMDNPSIFFPPGTAVETELKMVEVERNG